jgi:hypothetical protein
MWYLEMYFIKQILNKAEYKINMSTYLCLIKYYNAI